MLPTVPSTTFPSEPPWRRTRSPTRNGREPRRTIPAITLPSVLWAATGATGRFRGDDARECRLLEVVDVACARRVRFRRGDARLLLDGLRTRAAHQSMSARSPKMRSSTDAQNGLFR